MVCVLEETSLCYMWSHVMLKCKPWYVQPWSRCLTAAWPCCSLPMCSLRGFGRGLINHWQITSKATSTAIKAGQMQNCNWTSWSFKANTRTSWLFVKVSGAESLEWLRETQPCVWEQTQLCTVVSVPVCNAPRARRSLERSKSHSLYCWI